MLQVLFETDGRSQVYHPRPKTRRRSAAPNDNDIVLNDFSVSRRHAYSEAASDGEWVLYDNQSTNGVRVNDRHVPNASGRAAATTR